MSSIRFTSFGAATVPLSKVIIDKDLEMGQYTIIANEVRAGKVYSPIDTEEWETETLEWGDVPENIAVSLESTINVPSSSSQVEVLTWETPDTPRRWEARLIIGGTPYGQMRLSFVSGGTTIHSFNVVGGNTYTISLILPHSATVSLIADNQWSYTQSVNAGSYIKNTGLFAGAKTFNLTGKWLALGFDMKGLEATIKIQGVEIPYSDYAKYFPLAPTELKIPGDWDILQERPVIKVYK
jgi:hypothetical protein